MSSDTAEPTAVQRSLVLDLVAPNDEVKRAVRGSIRRYRAAASTAFGTLLLAQHAGATVEEMPDGDVRVKPDGARARAILAAAMGQDGAALAYQMRRWVLDDLLPGSMSFVWDSLRRDVATAWTAKDPEFTRVSRGWLALQGSRGVAQFHRRGIGFPVATGRPRLEGRELVLRWHRDIGTVRFGLPPLDGGRYHVWRALRDGDEGWTLGTVYLTERDGHLRAVITYSRPRDVASVDPERTLSVTLSGRDDVLWRMHGPDGAETFDVLAGCEVRDWLNQTYARGQRLAARVAACGNKRRPWGDAPLFRVAQEVRGRATVKRLRGVEHRNHAWTRRMVARALGWRCGRIVVTRPDKSLLFGHPWNWTQFEHGLRYKAEERGIVVEFVRAPLAPGAAHVGGESSV